jgi:hypothetical protein
LVHIQKFNQLKEEIKNFIPDSDANDSNGFSVSTFRFLENPEVSVDQRRKPFCLLNNFEV